MVPTYGFCEIPPAEEYAESVCDEFFSLPLFPQSSCAFENVGGEAAGATTVFNGKTAACPGAQPTGGCCGRVSTCSNCGTTCQCSGNICPRCGSTMSSLS